MKLRALAPLVKVLVVPRRERMCALRPEHRQALARALCNDLEVVIDRDLPEPLPRCAEFFDGLIDCLVSVPALFEIPLRALERGIDLAHGGLVEPFTQGAELMGGNGCIAANAEGFERFTRIIRGEA